MSRTIALAALFALTAAIPLSGCGRKGPLDPPPASSLQQPADGQSGSGGASGQRGAQPLEYGPDGQPLAPRGAKRRLPLDVLID